MFKQVLNYIQCQNQDNLFCKQIVQFINKQKMSRYSFRNNMKNFNRPSDSSIKLQKIKYVKNLQKYLAKELPSCMEQIQEAPENKESNNITHNNKNNSKSVAKQNHISPIFKTLNLYGLKDNVNFSQNKLTKLSKQKKSKSFLLSAKNEQKKKNNSSLISSKNANSKHKFSILKVLAQEHPNNSYRYKNKDNGSSKSSYYQIRNKITEIIKKSQLDQNKHKKVDFNHQHQNLELSDQFILSGYIKIYLKQSKSTIAPNSSLEYELHYLKTIWELYEIKLKLCPDVWDNHDSQLFQQMKALNQQLENVSKGKKQTSIKNAMKKFITIITA